LKEHPLHSKVGFQVLTAVTTKSMVFWVVMPFSLEWAQHFIPIYFWDYFSTLTMEVICSFKMSGSSQTA
jgi:hypothetical protein